MADRIRKSCHLLLSRTFRGSIPTGRLRRAGQLGATVCCILFVVTAPVAGQQTVPASAVGARGQPAVVGGGSDAIANAGTNGSVAAANGLSPLPGPAIARDLDDDGRHEDINADGTLTNADAHALLVAIRDGHSLVTPAFDFNGDGQLTRADARVLFGATSTGRFDSDRDLDGLTNTFERHVSETDPDDADSESGLTNTTEADDGTPDGRERLDGDTLTALQEQRLGTDPGGVDSDGDGIQDGNETYTRSISSDTTDARVQVTGSGAAVARTKITTDPSREGAIGGLGVSPLLRVQTTGRVANATVTIPYNSSAVADESQLAVLRYDRSEGDISLLDATVDTANGTVTATTSGFSTFLVIRTGPDGPLVQQSRRNTTTPASEDDDRGPVAGSFYVLLYANNDIQTNVAIGGPIGEGGVGSWDKAVEPEAFLYTLSRSKEVNLDIPPADTWYRVRIEGTAAGETRSYSASLAVVGGEQSKQVSFSVSNGTLSNQTLDVTFLPRLDFTRNYSVLLDQYRLTAGTPYRYHPAGCNGTTVSNDFENGTVVSSLEGDIVERGGVGERSIKLSTFPDEWTGTGPHEICVSGYGEFTFTAVLRTVYDPGRGNTADDEDDILQPPDNGNISDDVDDDGLTNGREFEVGTNMSKADTDDDGLVDSRELDMETAPTNSDTDGDGLPDGVEVRGIPVVDWYNYSVDADSANTIDLYGDAGPDGVKTDPMTADTDGDGIPDGSEVGDAAASVGNVTIYLLRSDPTDNNTDDMGLPDAAERAKGSSPSTPEWISIQATIPVLAKEGANTNTCQQSLTELGCARDPRYGEYILSNQNEYNPGSKTLGGKPSWLSNVDPEAACKRHFPNADEAGDCTFRLVSFGVKMEAMGTTINPERDYPRRLHFEATGEGAIIAQSHELDALGKGRPVVFRYASTPQDQVGQHYQSKMTVYLVTVSPSDGGFDSLGSIHMQVGWEKDSAFLREKQVVRTGSRYAFTEVSTRTVGFVDATRRTSPGEAKDMARRSLNYLANTLEDAAAVIAPTGGSAVQILSGGGGAIRVAAVEGMVLLFDIALEQRTAALRSDGFVPWVIKDIGQGRLATPRTIYGVTVYNEN